MNNLPDKFMEVVEKARVWAEKYRDRTNKTRSFPSDLCGMCGIASAKLFVMLQEAGYKTHKIAIAEGHVFIVYRGYIIDITATQFEKPRIFVCTVKRARARLDYHYRYHTLVGSIEELDRRQSGWQRDEKVSSVCCLKKYIKVQ